MSSLRRFWVFSGDRAGNDPTHVVSLGLLVRRLCSRRFGGLVGGLGGGPRGWLLVGRVSGREILPDRRSRVVPADGHRDSPWTATFSPCRCLLAYLLAGSPRVLLTDRYMFEPTALAGCYGADR